ncbi:pentapeptide repeat-containing protein [Spirillospora sp. NBC_00431]
MERLQRRAQYELAKPAARAAGVALTGLGLAVLAAAYAVAMWKMPDWIEVSQPRDRHNARLLVVSVGGAIVVAISLLYTARNYRLSHRGQVTDRFTKALERLSSTDIDARLGGIHALAHVAADSRNHHDDVIEVLEAFVRRRAPNPGPFPHLRRDPGPTLGRPRRLPNRPDSDVQAALTALGRRPHRPEHRTLDLSDLYLHRARLASLNLSRTDLTGVTLGGADLQGADLQGADLRSADLRDADLKAADLRGALLQGALLEGANLRGADLRDAILNTKLTGVLLWGADLCGAGLCGAGLHGADLHGADLRGMFGPSEQEIRAVARVSASTLF